MLRLTDGVFVVPAGLVGAVTVLLLRHFTHMPQPAMAFFGLAVGMAAGIGLYALWRMLKRRLSN